MSTPTSAPNEISAEEVEALKEVWHLLTTEEQAEAEAHLLALAGIQDGDLEWLPLPGPQTEAYYSDADELLYGGSAGGGKMLALGVMIPTPGGWKAMGDLSDGDEIFDETGAVCRVVIAHPIEERPVSYRLTFDEGTEIEACADHKWLTFDAKELGALTRLDPEWRAARQLRRASQASGNRTEAFTASITATNKTRVYDYKSAPTGTVRTTQTIFETLRTATGRTNHAVPVTKALQLPEADLLLDPYCLGAWLGDGSSRNGQFTGIDPEIWQNFEANGFEVRHYCEKQHNVLGLQVLLRGLGVLGNKHVPPQYLRASASQRMALLQGLMDTDGTVTDGGAVEFTNTNKAIAEAALELIVSLGWKARLVTGRATLNGKDCGEKYDIKWTPSEYVFRLKRKRDKQKLATRRTTKFRYIVGCERIEPIPMRCITVDSPSRLYLASRSMVPTHNTDLLLGLAGTAHHSSIIFRRVFPSMRGIIERSREVYNCRGDDHTKDSYNESLHIWRMGDGRMIELASMQHEQTKEDFRGRPHDLYAWDEVTEFTESQFRFVNAWNRSTRPGQRCRIVATCNPPTTSEGRWIIKYWAPWLDDRHPNPAVPGELRWFASIEGKDVEVESRAPFVHKGEEVRPRSRTFVAARLADNPYLEKTGYRATLQSLPEPLRSQMLYGNFRAAMADDPWQVIPTPWIDAAIDRGKITPRPNVGLSALGADPSRGGRDEFVIAPRWDNWFGAPTAYTPGKDEMPAEIDGPTGAKLILDEHADQAHINVDVIGIGASTYDSLKSTPGVQVNPINNSETAKEWKVVEGEWQEVPMRDKSGKFKLTNVRTASYWKLREALDPESGMNICLPDDAEMRSDLMAPTFKVTPAGIVVEPKSGTGSISERLGRSPGKGDGIVLANWIVTLAPADWTTDNSMLSALRARYAQAGKEDEKQTQPQGQAVDDDTPTTALPTTTAMPGRLQEILKKRLEAKR